MSDATAARLWYFYVADMLGFCDKVMTFTTGLSLKDVVADGMRFDATVRNIELIEEAATHVPDAVRNAHPEIPWRMVIATRNQLIHGYLGIDQDTLWSLITTDIPALRAHLPAIHPPMTDSP
jgi:uncharacterized protein with HEPN domain